MHLISSLSNARQSIRYSPAWVLLMLIVGFIIYGSLFPFNFQSTPQPFEKLFVSWSPLGQRSDAIDNFLLFIPLGVTLYFCFNHTFGRVFAVLVCWLVLGVLLQIAQLYLPSRVASLTDSFWNALGLITGLFFSYFLAPWLYRQASHMKEPQDQFAVILVSVWLVYESFPFIPTLDIGELRGHLKTFFYAPPFEWMRLWQHLLAAVLGVIALLRVKFLQQRFLVVVAAAIVLIGFEILVAYGDLRRETLLGIVIGLLLGERLEYKLRTPWIWYVIATLAFIVYLITVLLPFRGQSANGAFILTPFALLLWFGNTKAVSPTAFEVLAIGSLLWSGLSVFTRRLWVWPVLLALLLLMLEGVRIFLVGYDGDTTPIIILAVLVPFAISLHRKQYSSTTAVQANSRLSVGTSLLETVSLSIQGFGDQKKNWVSIFLTITAISLGLWLLIQLPGMPYNLRELFGEQRLFGSVVFAMALLWLGAGPWWIAQQAGKKSWPVLWLPFWLILTVCISLLFVKLSVTAESLGDVTGAADLYRRIVQENLWGDDWRNRLADWPAVLINFIESAIRFSALYGLLLIPLTLCALFTNRLWRLPTSMGGIIVLILLWWLAKWIVVDMAITDNIVELIAVDGVPYLGALLLLAALHVTFLSHASFRNSIILAIGSALSLPLSWWLLNQGLEIVLFKYDVVFSAPQFLLGANRNDWLTEDELLLRWAVLYLGMVGVIAVGMRFARQLTAEFSTKNSNL